MRQGSGKELEPYGKAITMPTKEELEQRIAELEAEREAANVTSREDVAPAEGTGVPTLTQVANKGIDPSNTYEHGAGTNVNQAVPPDAEQVTDINAAMDAGYFGYSPGAKATQDMTAQAAGKRNQRQREARMATRNRSAAAEEADNS